MAAAFPHHYEATVTLSDFDRAEGTLSTATAPEVEVGPPLQFDGRPGHQSPEELLLGAIATCHMTTLVALARRKQVPLVRYVARASGTLEKTREGLRFTSFRLHVDCTTSPGSEAELSRLVEVAEGYCIVSGALKVEVELESSVTATA
jgi:organic hydroperoxide reductase OsmC/OhrA